MPTFNELFISPEQDAELRAWIGRRKAAGEPWETLAFRCMIFQMLAKPNHGQCCNCGTFHVFISPEEAEEYVKIYNETRSPNEQPMDIAHYIHCKGCGSPGDAFQRVELKTMPSKPVHFFALHHSYLWE